MFKALFCRTLTIREVHYHHDHHQQQPTTSRHSDLWWTTPSHWYVAS